MARYIQKFGGTSVGSLERIQHVARLIEHTYRAGHELVVVLSAMSGETDRLMKLAKTLSVDPDDRELDVLLSSGERVTIALMAMTLKSLGVKAQSFTGRQVGIITDSMHTKARVSRVDTDRVLGALRDGIVPIVAGFQGINAASDVTTLGRGGSDLTAVVLAAALKADTCFIYTDVDGVYTADPNIVPGARRLDKISYEEMLELASLGAKVLQSRSVELAAKYQVPVEVRSSFQDGPGTRVVKEDVDMEQVLVSGVTGDRNQAKVTVVGVPDQPGIAATLFCSIADAAINVDMIIQNVGRDRGAPDRAHVGGSPRLPRRLAPRVAADRLRLDRLGRGAAACVPPDDDPGRRLDRRGERSARGRTRAGRPRRARAPWRAARSCRS